ncbi:hypothetical protein, partial [Helicobacter bilis]
MKKLIFAVLLGTFVYCDFQHLGYEKINHIKHPPPPFFCHTERSEVSIHSPPTTSYKKYSLA